MLRKNVPCLNIWPSSKLPNKQLNHKKAPLSAVLFFISQKTVCRFHFLPYIISGEMSQTLLDNHFLKSHNMLYFIELGDNKCQKTLQISSPQSTSA